MAEEVQGAPAVPREAQLQALIALEWKQFSAVHNTGGPASCQSMPETFALMRRSQAAAWDDATLAARLEDYRAAEARGDNLMTEKYARMMEYTHPAEYAAFADSLPPVETATRMLIEAIVSINLAWRDELAARYPRLSRRGRPLRSSQDRFGTSFETYLRGELLTCSPRTVQLWHAHVQDCRARGINLGAEDLTRQVQGYGYADLDAAERTLA